MINHGKPLLALTAALLLAGCASNGDPRDPLEPFNRGVQSFNDTVDRVAMKPIARGYRAVAPEPVQNSVRNFYSNLDDVTVFTNSLLQFRLEQATSDLLRIAFNSSFGLLGLIDIATPMGLKKHNEDFGQTLGRWGVGSGPYLVLPFFGPSSFRDGVGLAVDSATTDLVYDIEDIPTRNAALVVRAVSHRADLLDAQRALEEAALDNYEFTRDFYLERREALVQDGRQQPAE
ncbi:VacJ family lipoprotein [Parasulfuritortus cantonensis]|uniref:VacJ family lipoprotein n=1 Tax=Parasulfuritortus cantonensis TaxID=2528202 RepID=A0A4R1B5V6_9PROT|nr:VacJ family lipoprotein [Parasulfuritortus cantonensis]TCJ12930.1 VacJ family lipoprotein [Parasulfuritortus cantonensis]